MTLPERTVCPGCREQIRAELRAAAVTMLDQADRNDRHGDKRNSRWARMAAFGYLRATAVVRRGL